LVFGECDFAGIKMDGPFQVGYKEFETVALGNAVSVYYPISKEEFNSKMMTHNVSWLRAGRKTLKGIANASLPYGSTDEPNLAKFKLLERVQMDVVWEGTPAVESAVPIIYSHGISSNRTMHSGTARDFASHGYVVFIMDHKDRTSSYVRDGEQDIFYDPMHKAEDFEFRCRQIKIREQEVEELITEISDNDFGKERLGIKL